MPHSNLDHSLAPESSAPPPTEMVEGLRAVAVGDEQLYRRVKAAVLALDDQPPAGLTHAQEALAGPRLLAAVLTELGITASAVAADPQLRGMLCEVAAVAAPRLLPVLTGHFALSTGMLLAHGNGSAFQRAALDLLDTGAAVGVFALTELGGTNGADQTTTATWDPSIDGFRLDTVGGVAGVKFMPNIAGAATGATANVVVVLARLVVDGIDHGVLPFLLPPLTGPTPDVGIRITALPEKVGSAMQHAAIAFDGLVLPRQALLAGEWATLGLDGRFHSELTAGQRLRTTLSVLDAGRLDLGMAAVATARAALAGLVTYAAQRTPGGTAMLDRDAVRRDLVTALARVWAATALGRALAGLPADDPDRSLWSMLAKPLLSATALDVLLTCQARLGAHGTLRINWLPDWIANTIHLGIAEGESQVMAITAGRQRARRTELALPGAPAVRHRWAQLLTTRETALAESVRDGEPDPGGTALGLDGAAADLAEATAERAAAHALHAAAAATPDPQARRLLGSLAAAYGLERVLAHASFTAHRRLKPAQAADLTEQLRRHQRDLLDHLHLLSDAFDIPTLTGPVFSGDYLTSWNTHLTP